MPKKTQATAEEVARAQRIAARRRENQVPPGLTRRRQEQAAAQREVDLLKSMGASPIRMRQAERTLTRAQQATQRQVDNAQSRGRPIS